MLLKGRLPPPPPPDESLTGSNIYPMALIAISGLVTSLTILTVRPVAFFERIPGCTPTISATLSSSDPRLVS